MNKVKFFYDGGKITSRNPNKKERKFLKVYKDIIGFDVEIEYHQELYTKEWSCHASSENDSHVYFIKSEYTFDESLCGSSGFGNKSSAFDHMISLFKRDLREYYVKFASNYNYFSK
jgi:hypothetical protein